MSLSDQSNRNGPTRRHALLALAGAGLLLGGCQVRPLYGTWGATYSDAPVQGELAAIDIALIDTVDDSDLERVGQLLRNELLFGFRRGGEGDAPRYRLRVILDRKRSEVGVERLSDVPASYTLTMNASFVLSDYATDKTLLTGRSFASASYDFSSQRFANLRAERDAEDRAAKVIAGDVQTRIAGFLAEQQG
ncbi:hypothetical protein H2509_17470 [Stappia sp. F7233]|uniref:LPS-assembly lipoprotein n=1 Tax=Stappia albiluteola TaxID=2758565 RepID=A0A839AGD3_9HYPH|nr:LPS assembly lipoprotein LptE [Stappia albiluteola]MBA5778920.1 hypothetical protein [Stappia albiluteola]